MPYLMNFQFFHSMLYYRFPALTCKNLSRCLENCITADNSRDGRLCKDFCKVVVFW